MMDQKRDLETCVPYKEWGGVLWLVQDLQQLINDKETADVLFVIGKQQVEFWSHKLLLWTRCKSFQKYRQQFWRSRTAPGPLTFKYSHYDPCIFKDVLSYIYTGMLELNDNMVFPTLVMSKELGMEELKHTCEKYIVANLRVDNACCFLSAALQRNDSEMNLSAGDDEFVDACVSFIERNAEQCVATETWLELPKEAVTRLVSSDDFALEEEKVWRGVLQWAKYRAGVPLDKKPQHWSDHEKTLVADVLDGVVEHIKLLLIDSKVFAEEVEPTGVVPMEVTLERYKYAAVPEKISNVTEDKRLQPRVAIQLFPESVILTSDNTQHQRLLNQWYGKSKQNWKLLYRASSNGYTAEEFHTHCDGQAPTFVIIKGSTGSICGGFSDVAWSSNTSPQGRFHPSHKSFLFTLVNNQDVPPSKFEISQSNCATLHHSSYGPIFGAGADLCIADHCNTSMESYSNLPLSYTGEGASNSILMGDYNFNIADYEVFTTADT